MSSECSCIFRGHHDGSLALYCTDSVLVAAFLNGLCCGAILTPLNITLVVEGAFNALVNKAVEELATYTQIPIVTRYIGARERSMGDLRPVRKA